MVDLDDLLSPISVAAPAGEDLRSSDVYNSIVAALFSVEPDWDEVAALCAWALTTRTKDLQLACWLAEALCHCSSLRGLAEGLGLVTALCEQFWDCLYPSITREDATSRLTPLLTLEGHVVHWLMQMRLTDADRGNGTCYTLQHWIAAEGLSALSGLNPTAYREALVRGAIPLARMRKTVGHTPKAWFQRQLHGVQLCEVAVSELASLLDSCCGPVAPRFSWLLGMLAKTEHTIGVIASERLQQQRTE